MAKGFFCKLLGCKEVTLEYGYPRGSQVWLTVKKCVRCETVTNEWDDLFAEPRPESLHINRSYMYYADGTPKSD